MTVVPFFRPEIDESDIAAVVETLRSGWITTGPKVQEFEAAFARYVGAPHAVAVSSCTAALHLSMLAAGDDFVTILEGYPWMEREDILACLAYAQKVVGHERVEPFILEKSA